MNSKLHTSIDHLVIAAPSLNAGVTYVYDTLGVMPQPGGTHVKMGTHNALLRLGSSTYLEVISVNPELQKPDRPRWFELDKLSPTANPKLLTWVARTNNIRQATAISSMDFGAIGPMSRTELNWLITIPSDGSLQCDGIAPSLIQWSGDLHPARKLFDVGCSLIRLEGFHSSAKLIHDTLDAIGFKGTFSVQQIDETESPHLAAYVQTPNGIRKLNNSFRQYEHH